MTACNYCFLFFLLCFVVPAILCSVYIHLCDIDTFKERKKKKKLKKFKMSVTEYENLQKAVN